MKSSNPIRLLTLAATTLLALPPVTAQTAKPKLVVLIAVDQFRYDYLPRFRSEYTGGLKALLERGAVFSDARLEHYPTVTAIGHSTMLTGATPSVSGIIGNDWYDREDGEQVTSVSDKHYQALGGKETGASPRRLLVDTLGDEMKRALRPTPKVIGISLKDRSAILPSGHMADAAYWWDDVTGHFVSSTYYFPDLPEWVKSFNNAGNPEKMAGKKWLNYTLAASGKALYAGIYKSPYGNDLLEQFVEAAVTAEKLGQSGSTDLLTVSFSSNDAVGHEWGPDSPEAHEVSLNVDQAIGRLFGFLDRTVGAGQYVVALTADHGVSPDPDLLVKQKMPGGRLNVPIWETMKKALEERYGPGNWILSTAGTSPYFNWNLMAEKKLDPAEVERVAADAIAMLPHVARVYRRHQLLESPATDDPFFSRVVRGFNARRSGDLEILLEPYWLRGSKGTTHGTPYGYDNHIPLILMGPGVRPGRYLQKAALNDLAPTLAAILDVEAPGGSVGRILGEALQLK